MPAPSRKAPHNPLPLLLHCSLERASLSVGHVARLLHKPHKSGRFMLSSGHHDDRAEVRNAVKFQRGCFCLNKGPFLRDTGLGSGICGHSPAVDTKLLGSQTQSHSRQRPFPPRHWLRFRDLWSRPCGGHDTGEESIRLSSQPLWQIHSSCTRLPLKERRFNIASTLEFCFFSLNKEI